MTSGQVIDTGKIGKFRIFDHAQEKWNDWKFQFVSWLSLLQADFPNYLDEAEKATHVVNMPENAIVKALAIQFRAILALSTQG